MAAPRRSERLVMTDGGKTTLFAVEADIMSIDIDANDFVRDAQRFAKALDVISVSSKSSSEKRADIFKLANAYYEAATENVHDLRESTRRLSKPAQRHFEDESSDSMDVDEAEDARQNPPASDQLKHWEMEVQTWDLVRRLLPLRYPERKTAQPKRREPSRFQTGSELWEEFLKSDSIARERKAILECLQQTADETSRDIDEMVRELQTKAERGDIIAYGWLHTKSAIKMQKKVHGWSGPIDPNSLDVTARFDSNGATQLVTHLDPDVVTRQTRKLQPQDEYFERAIWLGCYQLLRRGRSLAEIREWCVERTEVWRAVSMSAMPLSQEGEDGQQAPNPMALLLWRRTCFALARQGGTDDFERAVYGILSGDIQSVEKVCETWDDHVFAHYNALLRTQFDSYVMERSSPEATQAVTQSFPAFNAVQFHGDANAVGERLVSSLESQPRTSQEARAPMKALQGSIISNTIDQYIYNDGAVLGYSANKDSLSALIPDHAKLDQRFDQSKYFRLRDHNGLRVLVHVYLLISSLEELQSGADDDELRKTKENVLAAYVSALRLNNMVELIPLYCSKLQGERAFFTLSRNVSVVTEMEERKTILRIMEKLDMDIAEFVVYQPSSLLQQYPENLHRLQSGHLSLFLSKPPSLKYGRQLKPDFFGEIPEDLDLADEQLIRSFEWMLLVDGLWDETFGIGVAIYKRFLKTFNLHAARALSERVKCADIFRTKAGLAIREDSDLSWFTDLDENNPPLYEDGSSPRQMITARNFLELESLVRALDAIETIGSMVGLVDEPTSSLGREFWAAAGRQVKSLKSFMQPCLRNWLVESIDDEDDFTLLRDMYLPEVMLGYVSVLHFAGTSMGRDNLLECMELAALIAEKDNDVQAVLMKNGRMVELVEAFANCSKALAVITSQEKKGGTGGSSKKMRELGWSRDLWTVKR